MNEFEVKTRFVFDNVLKVKALNGQQAGEFMQAHCGIVIGGVIHSSPPSEDIDWDFSAHPEKEID